MIGEAKLGVLEQVPKEVLAQHELVIPDGRAVLVCQLSWSGDISGDPTIRLVWDCWVPFQVPGCCQGKPGLGLALAVGLLEDVEVVDVVVVQHQTAVAVLGPGDGLRGLVEVVEDLGVPDQVVGLRPQHHRGDSRGSAGGNPC